MITIIRDDKVVTRENVNKFNAEGLTPLMSLILNDDITNIKRATKILLKLGADVNIARENGSTVLFYAVYDARRHCTEEIVRMLLSAGADINKNNSAGDTALILAARNSRTFSTEKTVALLLEYGANVNIANNQGLTPLMYASMYAGVNSSEKTVELLLKAGADVNWLTNKGRSALVIAHSHMPKNSTERAIELLLKYGAMIDQSLQNNKIIIKCQRRVNKMKAIEELIDQRVEERVQLLKNELIEDLYSPDGLGAQKAISRLNNNY
jgi:ankyrin repeat protein